MGSLTSSRIVTVTALALVLASSARGEEARDTARRVMHEALAERAMSPTKPPVLPERAAVDAARAREQVATAKAAAANATRGATRHGALDARTWRVDAANRAAAGATMSHGPGTMHWDTNSSGWGSDCNNAAGMMQTMDSHHGGGMTSGGSGGMPGHR